MFVLSHPNGNENVRALLAELEKQSILSFFQTTYSYSESNLFNTLLPLKIKKEAQRRTYNLPASKIYTRPFREIVRNLIIRSKYLNSVPLIKSWADIELLWDDFDKYTSQQIVKKSESHSFEFVYSYENTSYYTFLSAKELHLKCIYDLPIAYYESSRKLLLEEVERHSGWADTITFISKKNNSYYFEKKQAELELSDVVVCPSKFVINSLPSKIIESKQIIYSPFGSPQLSRSYIRGNNTSLNVLRSNRKFKVLFVGSLTSRKGLPDLFEAINMLNSNEIQLVILGSLLKPLEFYLSQCASVVYLNPRPHSEVLDVMRNCDIFVLPSIVEGRALVIQEAMSSGLPVIITSNTGADDLVINGLTGFIVPIRSPNLIAEKINWFLENSDRLPLMKQACIEKAATLTWENYSKTIIDSIYHN